MKQKDAVYAAIVSVLGTIEGNVGETITKEQRASANQILFEGFRAGEIDLDREFDDAGLKQYVSGLQSNWLRKDTRLNGGTKYVAKNPGSRAGSSDPQLKAMRTLLTTLTTDEEKAEVQGYIDARIAELNVGKAKTIDFSALPAGLAAKFQK